MLKPQQIDKLPEALIELYSQVEMDIIADMARRISGMDYFIPAAQWQYRKLIGGTVEVLLNSGIKMLAKLDAADDEGITISYEEKQAVEGKKRKQLVTVTRRYAFDEIKSTKEWLDFK